jgi:hypothetical protein
MFYASFIRMTLFGRVAWKVDIYKSKRYLNAATKLDVNLTN